MNLLVNRSLKNVFLLQEILGCNAEGESQNLSVAHPDPFLRSMALWILKDFTGSLNTLVQTNVGSMHPQYSDDDKPETTGEYFINLYISIHFFCTHRAFLYPTKAFHWSVVYGLPPQQCLV